MPRLLIPLAHSTSNSCLTIRNLSSMSSVHLTSFMYFFFFQAEDGIRDYKVTGVQTCALPISDADRGDAEVGAARDALQPHRALRHDRAQRADQGRRPRCRLSEPPRADRPREPLRGHQRLAVPPPAQLSRTRLRLAASTTATTCLCHHARPADWRTTEARQGPAVPR